MWIRYHAVVYQPWALGCSASDTEFRQFVSAINLGNFVLWGAHKLFDGFDDFFSFSQSCFVCNHNQTPHWLAYTCATVLRARCWW